jgi:DNA-binding transcriptional regulator GbsR (MarR family)
VISSRASFVYVYFLHIGTTLSANQLSKLVKEGREAMATALKELRHLGLLETKKVHIQGKIKTVSNVVEPDYWTPETRLLLQQSHLYSVLSTNGLYSKKQTEYLGEPENG